MNGLHEIEAIRLTKEEIDFLNNLARRIGKECYSYTLKNIRYDDMDRLYEITRRANTTEQNMRSICITLSS